MQAPHRILLIQLRALGDVILTTPALRVLRRSFPNAQIDFLTNPGPAEALAHNPHLNSVLVYPYQANDVWGLLRECRKLRGKRYDWAIDFLGTPATAILTLSSGAPVRVGYRLRFRKFAYTHHEVGYRGDIYNALAKFSLLKPLGIEEEEWQPEIFVPPAAEVWAQELFDHLGIAKEFVVALAPQAKRLARRWPGERFAKVGDDLQAQGHRVLIIWGPGEHDYVNSVAAKMQPSPVMMPQASLMQTAAILKRCRLLVCNCGGAKHIAVAAGTPTFTIHGPTNPNVWTPPNNPLHGYVRSDSRKMEDIRVEEVLDGIRVMKIL